jgi:hypothetical protein
MPGKPSPSWFRRFAVGVLGRRAAHQKGDGWHRRGGTCAEEAIAAQNPKSRAGTMSNISGSHHELSRAGWR